MSMGDNDWETLASTLVRQNYAFVAGFSVILWDCLITSRQEVKYIWHCSSRVTRRIFLFCRYFTITYFILCSLFDVQWVIQMPTSRTDCRTWFLIHASCFCLLYIGSELILIRKVFQLYEKSTLLASGLFALHCAQGAGSLKLGLQVSTSLNFDPICNGRNIPNISSTIIASFAFNQGIIWLLVLRKAWIVRPKPSLNWRRYLRTSNAHAGMSWGISVVAVLLASSHPFAIQRVATIYIFTGPMVVISIGACRYILRVEKDRNEQARSSEGIETAQGKPEQFVGEEQFYGDGLPSQSQHRHFIAPRQQAELPSSSNPEAPSTPNFSSEFGRPNLEMMVSNFPYLHGAWSYVLNLQRDRSSTATTIITTPTSSSGCQGQSTASVRNSPSSRASSSPYLRATGAVELEATHSEGQQDADERHHSASDIEIGSLHSSSSVNSEELRGFYNNMWNVGPFMAGGP